MSALRALHDAVAAEIAAGNIGRPVSLRGFLDVSPDHGRLVPALARWVETAAGWLDDAPARVMVSGSVESGHVTALVEGEAGTSCVIAASVQRDEVPLVDLIVLGSRGTVRHEGRADAFGVEEDDFPTGDRLSDRERRLLAALERSLASKEPVDVAKRSEEER